MSTLTSLLVRDQIVPVRKIEEALQRQVVSGGDTETVLLEMAVVAEDVLSAYRAALFGLLPATRDEVMKTPRDTVRLVPREVAEKHRLVPLWAEGRTLVVAVSTPLGGDSEHQLGFLLGFDLVQRVVTDVRVAAGLSHHYGVEMSGRLRRLAEKLRTRDPGIVPYVAPPQQARVDRHSLELPKKQGALSWEDDEDEEPTVHPASALGDDAKKTQVFGTPEPSTAPMPAPPVTPEAEPPAERPSQRPPVLESVPPGVGLAPMIGVGAPASIPTQVGGSSPSVSGSLAPGGTQSSPGRRTTGTLLRRVRGPLPSKAAQELLGKAEDRDSILEVLFAFAKQFFDYTALFIVHEDIAEGRDAFGAGANTEEVQRIAVPLDVPGTFAEVRKSQRGRVVQLQWNELDRIVARDLRREQYQPALIMPISIKSRVVVILYGDRGGENFGVDEMPEVDALVPRVVDAFERLLMKRKAKGWGASGEMPAVRDSLKAAATAMVDVPPPRPKAAPDVAWGGPERTSVPTLPTPAHDQSVGQVMRTDPAPPPDEEVVDVVAPVAQPSNKAVRSRSPTPLDRPPIDRAARAWQPAPRRPTPRPAPLSVLGVPRTAPPPPMPVPVVPDVDWTGREASPDLATPAPPDATLEGPPAAPEVAVPPPDDEPQMTLDSAGTDVVDGEGMLEDDLGDADLDAEDTQPNRKMHGVYVMHEAGSEHVDVTRKQGTPSSGVSPSSQTPLGPGKTKRDTQPEGKAAKRTSYRPDPRRDEDDGRGGVDVVRVPKHRVPAEAAAASPRVSRVPAPGEPNVIVDMGDQVEQLVKELMLCGPDDEGNVVGSLLQLGEMALPTLVQKFPGPLWFDRNQPHRRLPRGRDVSGVARALSAFRERSVSYVAPLLDSEDAEQRFYATLLASEMVHPAFSDALGRRLFDDDAGTRALSLDVIKLFRHFREFDQVLQAIRTTARAPAKDPTRRRVAARALGELRDPKGVTLLIQLLRDEDKQLAQISHRSLVILTRQDFGDQAKRWEQWNEKHGGQHRVEWLIDALGHDSEEIRAAAGEELKRLTQEYYGYHPAASRRERERAQQKYQTWWNETGRKRFMPTNAPPARKHSED